MTSSKQRHGTRAPLGPEDVNELMLIYLEFQMSCSKILKSETLPVKSFSVSKLELLLFFPFSIVLCFLVFLKLLFGTRPSPSSPLPHLLWLSVEIISLFDTGMGTVSRVQISFFFKNCACHKVIFLRILGIQCLHFKVMCVLKQKQKRNKPVMCKVKCFWIYISLFSDVS